MSVLIPTYRSLLKYAKLDSTEDGYVIYRKKDGTQTPFKVGKLSAILPTPERLRAIQHEKEIVFNPLRELTFRAETDIYRAYAKALMIALNVTYGHVASSLFQIAGSPDQHSRLSESQLNYILALPEADEKTAVEFATNMVTGLKSSPENFFVSIFVRKGGEYEKKKYKRVGVTFFPFYEALKKKEGKWGRLSKKNYTSFVQMCEVLFPEMSVDEAYNFPTDSNLAPGFECLVKTSAKLADRLNQVMDDFASFIPEAEDLKFDMLWCDYLEQIEQLTLEVNKIPAQTSNTMEATDVPPWETRPASPPVQPANTYPGWVAPAPMPVPGFPMGGQPPAPAPVARSASGKLDLNAVLNQPHLNQFVQSAPMYGGFAQPAAMISTPYGQMAENALVKTMLGVMPLSQAIARRLGYEP